MSNTPYDEINDLFLSQIDDYRLVELYNGGDGVVELNTYLLGFMTLAIPEFYPCTQDLSDRTDASFTFDFEMTGENKKNTF